MTLCFFMNEPGNNKLLDHAEILAQKTQCPEQQRLSGSPRALLLKSNRNEPSKRHHSESVSKAVRQRLAHLEDGRLALEGRAVGGR